MRDVLISGKTSMTDDQPRPGNVTPEQEASWNQAKIEAFSAWLLKQSSEVQVRFEANCRNHGHHRMLADVRACMQKISARERGVPVDYRKEIEAAAWLLNEGSHSSR